MRFRRRGGEAEIGTGVGTGFGIKFVIGIEVGIGIGVKRIDVSRELLH